ncbi:hypothetical protein [Rhizobium sp. S163]|uniref:hypothetical protein n=1 Tax=Rhizobium sp. S163 TaxID=3055039 RepID=UPI0025AA1626|nr:hypothetical protein [Rhizobium sp. S163]MDM9647115.1 hypothetical protein [Rhizobium sp. S163]
MHDERYVCPLAGVDRRLEDVHRAWHDAENAYFDPDRFRFAVQTAIQTLRTVTFVLQSHKRLFPDFDAWYKPWQDRFRADKLMRWMVDARNKIEKQGDLETYSFVRAEIVASYFNEGPTIQVPANLSDAPLKLLKSIPENSLGDHVRKDGTMRISRRWVENSLPDYELLEAVARAYGQISLLVADAHKALGLAAPATTDQSVGTTFPKDGTDGRMPCMVGHEDQRTLNIWLADGRPVDFSSNKIELDLAEAKKLEAKYGVEAKAAFKISGKNEDLLKSLFEVARIMFVNDGHHVTIAFLLRDGVPIDIIQMAPSEHGEKYLMMRKLAHEVRKHAADAIILTSEVWTALFDDQHPYRRAVDAPDKREALTSSLVSKAGDPLQCWADIRREGQIVELSETHVLQGTALYAFSPIYEVWGKAIPEDWLMGAVDQDSQGRG